MRSWSRIAAGALAVAILGWARAGSAAEIKVLCSNGFAEVLNEVVPRFERATGHRVKVAYSETKTLVDRVRGGETADLLILIRHGLDELERQGKVAAASRADLATASIGVAVRAGAPTPDIGSVESFKRTMLAARAVAATRVGATGIHLMKVFERLGIAEQMRPKMRLVDRGVRAAELVARGDADLAVQLMSELLPVAGARVVGPLPPGLDETVVMSAGVFAGAAQPEGAKALVRFLAAPDVAPVLERKGMRRPQSP